MNNCEVLNGDCLEILKGLPDSYIHCCVTSPPYWGLRDYGHAGQMGLEETPEAYVARMVEVFCEVKRVLRDDGTLWLNLGDSYASFRDGKATPDTSRGESNGTSVPKGQAKNRMASTFLGTKIKHKDLVGIPWRVAFALQADGWYLRQDIIWHKPNPMPESVTDRCTKAHEYIFLLSKSAKYCFDSKSIKEPVAEATKDRSKYRWKRTQNGGGSKESMNGYDYASQDFGDMKVDLEEGRNRRSVWTVATKPYKDAHFATYPPELIAPCILAGCPVGGIVLDPFGGSGTTGAVAIENGRSAVLIELNPKYVELIKKRLSQVQPMLVM